MWSALPPQESVRDAIVIGSATKRIEPGFSSKIAQARTACLSWVSSSSEVDAPHLEHDGMNNRSMFTALGSG